jgi:hypothetical protein
MFLALGLVASAQADSIASSASSAGSASLGASSDSIHGSSNSSRHDNRVSEGDYNVLAVAQVAERPGMLRLTLHGKDTAEEFLLDLPAKALAQRAVAVGDVVSAHQRPYGLEFAHADTREPFFLVLADDWRRDLDSHAVTAL